MVTIDNSPTWNTGEVQSGGTLRCTNDTTARTVTIDNVKSGPNAGGSSAALWIKSGGTLDCDGATGVEGVDITFTYTGTIGASESYLPFVGDGSSSNLNLTTDATFKLRGLARGTGNVENVGAGATDDFVWCVDTTGITTEVVGDTVVFTSGRLDEFWCRVDAVNPNTAECSLTACGGGACDLEIDCNDAADGFRSFTLAAAGTGGPVRASVPTDCDGNGTADNDCAYPVNGDAVTIFKPALIQGNSATPIASGPTAYMYGAQINMRYVDFYRMGGLPTAQGCTNAGGSCSGWAAVGLFFVLPTASEGDIGYINIYEYGSQFAYEVNATDINTDSRANYPIATRHIYIHDPDSDVEACTCGSQRMGEGIALPVDQTTTAKILDMTFDGVHIARIYSQPFDLNDSSSLAQPTTLRFNNILIHDIPKTTTYGNDNSAVFRMSSGVDALVNGLAIWDIGNNNDDPEPVVIAPISATNGNAATSIRIQNLYVVNWDANEASPQDSAAMAVHANSSGIPATTETANVVISNSYISNMGAGAGSGGTWRYNFLLNNWIDNDGAAPCVSGTRRGTLRFPAEATGNVFWRTLTTACSLSSIFNDIANNGSAVYHAGTRKYFSNLFGDAYAEPAGQDIQSVYIHNTSGTDTTSTDIYNNLADLRDVNANGEYGLLRLPSSQAQTAVVNVYYNVIMNSLGASIWYSGSQTLNKGENRHFRIVNSPPFSGGVLTLGTDTDSDVDSFITSTDQNLYQFPCTPRTTSATGMPIGPLAFGIRDFGYFHPAVIASMNTLVYKMRFDWLMCSGANQDEVPR